MYTYTQQNNPHEPLGFIDEKNQSSERLVDLLMATLWLLHGSKDWIQASPCRVTLTQSHSAGSLVSSGSDTVTGPGAPQQRLTSCPGSC